MGRKYFERIICLISTWKHIQGSCNFSYKAGNLIAIGGSKMPGVWGAAPPAGSRGSAPAGSEGQRPWRGQGEPLAGSRGSAPKIPKLIT